jgi:hypothetical protein
MMNTIVVSLTKSCDDNMDRPQGTTTLLLASEKTVTSYCLLLHLLISLCRSKPEIICSATAKLKHFIQDPKARLKQTTPGELIIIITLVLMITDGKAPPITWEPFRGPFLREAATRNVRWVLDHSPELSDFRIETIFNGSKTSLHVSDHVLFLGNRDLAVG